MNYEKMKGLSSFGASVWVFSAWLQELTNRVLFRSFTVNVGIISNKNMPAVVMSVNRLFGRNEVVGMDLHSFLDMVKHIVNDEKTDYTVAGFDVHDFFTKRAPHKVDMSQFTIPPWAFPKAELAMMQCAGTIIDTAKRFDSTIDKVAKVMLEAGVPEAEVEKFTSNVRTGAHAKESEKHTPTIH